jgi:hypothetical protein
MKKTDYFLLVTDHYVNKFDMNRNVVFEQLSDFMLTHGGEAVEDLYGSIVWSEKNKDVVERDAFQREIYVHDVINGKDDKWMLPRSSDYRVHIK